MRGRARPRALGGVTLLLAAACGGGSADPGPDAAPIAEPAWFTEMGRWPDASRLTFRCEPQGAPVPEAVLRDAVHRALGAWTAIGPVGFAEAGPGEAAAITFAFRRGAHDACEPFGASTAIAHASGPGGAAFVHFDAARPWSADGGSGHSVYHTAMHEIGHVLGLGHSDCPDSLLSPDVTPRPRITGAERAGVWSLYGGGTDAGSDLHIDSGPVLRRVAPPDRTGFLACDTDGNGSAELLVWRHDARGHGALMIYHFAPGPRLHRTLGPVYGMAAPGAGLRAGPGPGGERLLWCVLSDAAPVVRRFTAAGTLEPCELDPAPPPPPAPAADVDGVLADLDGDGHRERITRGRR